MAAIRKGTIPPRVPKKRTFMLCLGRPQLRIFHVRVRVSNSVPLGFQFNFYGTKFSTVNMSTNGFLHFDTNQDWDSALNQCVPDAIALNNLIAILWDDLVVNNPGVAGRIRSHRNQRQIGLRPATGERLRSM